MYIRRVSAAVLPFFNKLQQSIDRLNFKILLLEITSRQSVARIQKPTHMSNMSVVSIDAASRDAAI